MSESESVGPKLPSCGCCCCQLVIGPAQQELDDAGRPNQPAVPAAEPGDVQVKREAMKDDGNGNDTSKTDHQAEEPKMPVQAPVAETSEPGSSGLPKEPAGSEVSTVPTGVPEAPMDIEKPVVVEQEPTVPTEVPEAAMEPEKSTVVDPETQPLHAMAGDAAETVPVEAPVAEVQDAIMEEQADAENVVPKADAVPEAEAPQELSSKADEVPGVEEKVAEEAEAAEKVAEAEAAAVPEAEALEGEARKADKEEEATKADAKAEAEEAKEDGPVNETTPGLAWLADNDKERSETKDKQKSSGQAGLGAFFNPVSSGKKHSDDNDNQDRG